MRRVFLPLLLVLAFVPALWAPAAWARGGEATPPPAPPREEAVREVAVPDVGGLHLALARERLEAAGFTIGRIEQYTPAQAQAIFEQYGLRGRRGVIDHVFQQSPRPGTKQRTNRPVDLRVCAREAGVRQGIPSRRGAVPPPAAPIPTPIPTPADPRPGVDPAPEPADGGGEEPSGDPRSPLPGLSGPPASTDGATGPMAVGSPEAPRVVEVARADLVPSLLGLSLHDAEQMVLDAGMRLHVDRVAGHPIGRVLEQAPSAGGRPPAGGVVRVVVTAGGDFDGEQAPIAPEVFLAKVVVPGLLDRTRLQALRIVEDLGLRVQEEKARRGLPGRVVDQMPPAGGRVPKGGIVRLWIGPGETEAPRAQPAPGPLPAAPAAPALPEEGGRSGASAPPPNATPPNAAPNPVIDDGALEPGSRTEAPRPEVPRAQPEVPAPQPPLAPGALPLGIPEPVSPGHGTVLPRQESVPIGFTWRAVPGAEAYLLEVEEEGAEGRWMPNARKPSKKTAVILEVERINSRSSGRLRWRVTAIRNGRAGTASKWVLLK